MQVGKELQSLSKREGDVISSEVTILVHVIDIGPDSLKRKVKVPEIVHNLLQLRPVLVTPAALMEAERPVLLHGGQTGYAVLILLGNCIDGRTAKEEEVNTAAQSAPCNVVVLQHHLLPVSVS